jgi:outer membrane autotransporter protein
VIAVACSEPTSRRLKSTVSVAALIAGVVTLASHGAIAGDVTVNANYSGSNVYGNSTIGDPSSLDGAASASNNILTLESSANVDIATGGQASGSAAANGNRVVVNGGRVMDLYGGFADGGGAANNSVTINGGQVHDARAGSSWDGIVEHNSVVINRGTASLAYGGWSDTGDVHDNAVQINGGQIGNVAGGYSQEATASYNTVTISGGTFQGSFISGGISDNGSAIYNTVTISGTPAFNNTGVELSGAYINGSHGDLFTGNRLELKTPGLIVGSLANFQYLDFYLPTTLAAGTTMLNVTGTANLTNGSGTSSVINVGINGASSPLALGDSFTLIQAGTLTTAAGLNSTATGTGMQGVTLAYTFGISVDGNNLIATVSSAPAVTDESKALSEGVVSAAALINQGADLANSKGMANAIATAGEGWSTFGAVSGGSQRTRTGSYVDVDGASLLAGFARQFDLAAGVATAGVFAEYGNGNYDTFNSFASGTVRGHGDSQYFGGGLIGHMDFSATRTGHAYAEAMARLGAAHNSFSSPDLVSGGIAAGYDASSVYAGASAALGYAWALDAATTLDVSGRYLWSRLGGDNVQLTTGETVDFDAVTSQRTRLGARLSHALPGGWTPFVAAAWEHEFDGDANATANGLALDAPSLAGDTGIFEAGLTLKPSRDLPLALDVGLQGFVGQREGMAGSLQAKWTF